MSILKPTDSQTTIRVLNSELGETEKKINKIGNSANKSTASIQYLEETLLGSIAFDPNGVPQYDTDDYGNIIYDITGNAVYKRNDDGLLSRLQQEIIGKADDGTVREYILKTSQLEQTVDGFDAKVQRVEANYGTLESRVSTAESKITADAIVNTVTGSEVFSNLSSRVSTAESKITDSAIINTVTSSKTYTDALSGKVSTTTYNSKMQQLDNAISSKVESDTYNSYVEQTDSAISSKVSSTDYTGAKVTSMINQSADSVKIQAKHVEVDGTLIIGSSAVDSKISTATNDMATKTYVGNQGYQTSSQVDTKIDGIKVGASNLVQDINKWNKSSAFTFINRADAHLNLMSSANDILKRAEGWTSAGLRFTRLHNGCTGWHIEGTATSTTTSSIFGANNSTQRLVDKTKKYTFSATVKNNNGTTPTFNIATSTSAYAFNRYCRTASGQTSLLITPTTTDYAWRYVGIDVVSGKNYNLDVYFKLEEGEVATPYSIAPTDLENDADTLVLTKRSALTWSNYTNLAYSSKVSDILGKDFTLSFDWKATSSTSSPTISFARFNAPFDGTSGTRGKYVAPNISSLVVGNRTGGVITTLENKQVSAEWKRFVVTFRINDVSFFTQGTGDYDYFGISLYNYTNSTDNALYIKNLKLEEGNKPTAYTPSNEELTSVTRRVRIDNDSVDIIDGDGEMVASYGEHITLKTGDLRLPNPKSFQIKDENNDTYRPLVGLKIGGDRTSNGWEWTIDQYGTVEATVRDKTEFTAQNTPFVTGLYYHDDTKSMVGLINQINAYKTKYAPTELANLNYDEPQEVHVLSTANGNSGSGYLTIWRTYFNKSDKMLHIRFVSNLQETPGTTYHTHKVYIIPSES